MDSYYYSTQKAKNSTWTVKTSWKADLIWERITYAQTYLHTSSCKLIDSTLKMHITILNFNFLDADNFNVSPCGNNLQHTYIY